MKVIVLGEEGLGFGEEHWEELGRGLLGGEHFGGLKIFFFWIQDN